MNQRSDNVAHSVSFHTKTIRAIVLFCVRSATLIATFYLLLTAPRWLEFIGVSSTHGTTPVAWLAMIVIASLTGSLLMVWIDRLESLPVRLLSGMLLLGSVLGMIRGLSRIPTFAFPPLGNDLFFPPETGMAAGGTLLLCLALMLPAPRPPVLHAPVPIRGFTLPTASRRERVVQCLELFLPIVLHSALICYLFLPHPIFTIALGLPLSVALFWSLNSVEEPRKLRRHASITIERLLWFGIGMLPLLAFPARAYFTGIPFLIIGLIAIGLMFSTVIMGGVRRMLKFRCGVDPRWLVPGSVAGGFLIGLTGDLPSGTADLQWIAAACVLGLAALGLIAVCGPRWALAGLALLALEIRNDVGFFLCLVPVGTACFAALHYARQGRLRWLALGGAAVGAGGLFYPAAALASFAGLLFWSLTWCAVAGVRHNSQTLIRAGMMQAAALVPGVLAGGLTASAILLMGGVSPWSQTRLQGLWITQYAGGFMQFHLGELTLAFAALACIGLCSVFQILRERDIQPLAGMIALAAWIVLFAVAFEIVNLLCVALVIMPVLWNARHAAEVTACPRSFQPLLRIVLILVLMALIFKPPPYGL